MYMWPIKQAATLQLLMNLLHGFLILLLALKRLRIDTSKSGKILDRCKKISVK